MRRELYERAIAHYGRKNQMHMVIEEMSELTKEICKNERGEDNRNKIVEEIVDVYITLEQLEIMFNISSAEKEAVRDFKLDRLRRKLNK